MPPESWLVVTVAAAFLLLGIAGSPLAWVVLHHRRSRSEQRMEATLARAGRPSAFARGPAGRVDAFRQAGMVHAEPASRVDGGRGVSTIDGARRESPTSHGRNPLTSPP